MAVTVQKAKTPEVPMSRTSGPEHAEDLFDFLSLAPTQAELQLEESIHRVLVRRAQPAGGINHSECL
jgi:hypothetical protein